MASTPSKRRYTNPWKPLRRSDITTYSYHSKTITPEYTDPAGRQAERLHTSLACLGALVSSNRVNTDGKDFSFQVRLFNDDSTVEDFNKMIKEEFLDGYKDKIVKVVDGSNLPNTVDMRTHSLDEWKRYKRIIVHYHMPPDKWAVFLVTPSKKKGQTAISVDGYLVGDIEVQELNALILLMTYSFHLCFERACPTYTRRLIISRSFETSNAFLSFLIIYYLARNGSYLDLTPDHIMKYKIMFSGSYREFHDSWLGNLSLEPTHPFIASGFEDRDNLSGLIDLGWTIVDVLGDGNCGYYSMILGLENMGIYTFSSNEKVLPRPARGRSKKSKVPSMEEYKDWQKCIVRFRDYLQQHSQYMLREVYPSEQRNLEDEMWIMAGVSEMADIDGNEKTVGLSQQIHNGKLETKEYFTEDFEEMVEYHMNPFWVPHVLASFKRLRVIVYTRVSGTETTWSVTTFDGTGGRVEVTQVGNIKDHNKLDEVRLTDLQFKERPTIELLFLNGYEEDSTNHFLFLRRFLCDGLPPAPPAVQPSLLDRMIALPINDDPWEFVGDLPEETWKQLRNSNRKTPPASQLNTSPNKSQRSKAMDTLASMRSSSGNEKAATMSKKTAETHKQSLSTKQTREHVAPVDTGAQTKKNEQLVDDSVNTPRSGDTQMNMRDTKAASTLMCETETSKVEAVAKAVVTRQSEVEVAKTVIPGLSEVQTESVETEAASTRTDQLIGGCTSPEVQATETSKMQSDVESVGTRPSGMQTESIGMGTTAKNTSQLVSESLKEKPGGMVSQVEVTTTPLRDDTTSNTKNSIGQSASEGTMPRKDVISEENNESAQEARAPNNVAVASHEQSSSGDSEDESTQEERASNDVAVGSDEQSSSEDSDDEAEQEARDRKRKFAELKKQTSHFVYKRKNKRAKCRQRAMDQKAINRMYERKEISNSRLLYDLEEDKFYSCKPFPTKAGYTKKVLEENPEEFGEFVYETALKRPGQWIGPSLGDAGDEDAPEELCCPDVPLLYQQHRKPYCLIYSLASALYYCGFHEQAQWIAQTAEPMSKMETDDQLQALLPMMRSFVPVIGNAYMWGVRTKGHNRKKRYLTWDNLFTTLSKYPTLVIPMLPNGDTTHAFCVVDDLIFDSSTPFALKLNMESVNWIFGGKKVELNRAYRFCNRWSPKNQKCEGEYEHELTLHWDRSEMGLPQIEVSTTTEDIE